MQEWRGEHLDPAALRHLEPGRRGLLGSRRTPQCAGRRARPRTHPTDSGHLQVAPQFENTIDYQTFEMDLLPGNLLFSICLKIKDFTLWNGDITKIFQLVKEWMQFLSE